MEPERSQSERAAWRAHELAQLRYFQALSLQRKLQAVQDMADVLRHFREMRRQGRFFHAD